jgi:hypothetical protein
MLVWFSQVLPLEPYLRIFEATCCSIPFLLYGSETWQPNKDMTNKFKSLATSCHRYILGIKRLDEVSNADVLQMVN